MAHGAAYTSRVYIDCSDFIDFSEKFKYLSSILHYTLTSDAGVYERFVSAMAAYDALKKIS